MLVRRRMLAPAVCCALALVAMPATAAAASRKADEPQAEVPWNAYPIDPGSRTTTAAATGTQTFAPAKSDPAPDAAQPTRSSSKRSSALRIAIIAAAAVVGIVVGLTPALMLGIMLGVVPRPRRVRPRRRARPAPARPAAPPPPPAPPPVGALVTFHERPPDPEPTPVRTLVPADLPEPDDGEDQEDLAAGDDRHRDLYDAAYADQLYRIESLRRTIRAGLTISTVSRGAQHVPPPGDDND